MSVLECLVNKQYFVNQKGVICNINGRSYIKYNAGPALVSYGRCNGWNGPNVVSDVYNAVTIQNSYNWVIAQAEISFKFMGITWYAGHTGFRWLDNNGSFQGFGKKIPDQPSLQAAALYMLKQSLAFQLVSCGGGIMVYLDGWKKL